MTAILNRRALMAAAGAGAVAFAASQLVLAQAPAKLPPAPKPEDWIKAPAVQFAALSPDGLHTVFLTEDGGNKFLNTFDIAAKKAGKINIGPAQVDGLQWASNTHVLVLTSVPAKRVNPQAGPGNYTIAIVYNLAAGTLLRLYDKVPKFGGLVNGDVHFIRRGGRDMVTASGIRDDHDGFVYLYAFDLDGKDYDMLDRAPQETIGWVVAGDGTPMARWAYYRIRKEWVLEYYNGNAWKEINRTKVVRYLPEVYGLGRDGKSVLVKTYDDDGDIGAYRELAQDGTFSSPMNEASGREPIIHPRTNILLGFTHDTGATLYEFSDPAMATIAVKAQAAMDGYRMEIVSYADDPNRVIVCSEGDDDAGTYYYIDFSTGLTLTVGAKYPDIAPEWTASKQVVSYKAADGLSIEAILTLPANVPAKALPLIVMPHRQFLARSDLSFDWIAATFAAAGYAVLQPNFRGSAGYGQAFISASYGQWGGKMQTDLSDGVRYLAGQGTIDAKRVAIFGDGLTGYLALAGADMDTGAYNCAIAVAPLSDVEAMMAMIGNGDTTSPTYLRWSRFFGDLTTYGTISPIRHASSATAPVLVLGGQDMPGQPFQQSQRMADALRSAGKTGDLVKLSATSDWSTSEAWRTEVMTPALAFLKKYNPA